MNMSALFIQIVFEHMFFSGGETLHNYRHGMHSMMLITPKRLLYCGLRINLGQIKPSNDMCQLHSYKVKICSQSYNLTCSNATELMCLTQLLIILIVSKCVRACVGGFVVASVKAEVMVTQDVNWRVSGGSSLQ